MLKVNHLLQEKLTKIKIRIIKKNKKKNKLKLNKLIYSIMNMSMKTKKKFWLLVRNIQQSKCKIITIQIYNRQIK